MDGIVFEERDPESPAARACLARYYAELDARFPEGFAVERSIDPEAERLRRPRGTFVVALREGDPVGCVAVKDAGPGYHEIKRMWIDPGQRGTGLARRLMAEAERIARELGVHTLRLDTNSALQDAIAIYRHWGWAEIERFNDDPYAHLFFEKRL